MSVELPPIPADLVGWQWRRTTDGGALLEGPDGWQSNRYLRNVDRAVGEARRHARAQQKAGVEGAQAPATPAIPPDLVGWAWEASPAGTLRLAHAAEGWASRWFPPLMAADALAEARAIVATDATRAAIAVAEEPVRRGPALRLSTAALAPHTPGPDAQGVYRRPPAMDARVLVSPTDLVDGRWQPRETYDQADLDELADSIREHGVLEDLVALANEAGQLELITGHRRRRAAQAAGLTAVPVKVVEATAAQAFELAVISNDQRSDLTDLERGRAYERMIAEQAISEAELARRLSRPRTYIQQRRNLAKAAPALQEAYAGGRLGFTAVRAVLEGSGGDHAVQQQVTAQALRLLAGGATLTAERLQRDAEDVVRSSCEQQLKRLGWASRRVWVGNTPHVYWYSSTAAPAEWSPAEQLAAVREGRRPPMEAPPLALLSKDDAEQVDRRGWRVQPDFAPWAAVERGGDGYVFGEAAHAAAATARAEVAALVARIEGAGWTVSWKYGSTLVAKKAGAGETSASSWADKVKLAGQIAKGKPPAAKEAAHTYSPTCAVCRKKSPQHEHLGGQTVCASCAPAVRAQLDQERAAIDAGLVAQGVITWVRTAPAWAADLLLVEHRSIWAADVLGQRSLGYLEPDQLWAFVQSLTPAQRMEALGAIVRDLAWDQRQGVSAHHTAPATAVAGGAPAGLPDHPDEAVSLATIAGWMDALAQAWDAGHATPSDAHTIEWIAGCLEDLADDATIDDAAYEAASRRLEDLATRMAELVAS